MGGIRTAKSSVQDSVGKGFAIWPENSSCNSKTRDRKVPLLQRVMSKAGRAVCNPLSVETHPQETGLLETKLQSRHPGELTYPLTSVVRIRGRTSTEFSSAARPFGYRGQSRLVLRGNRVC
jgi:hypothetical protein